MTEQVVWRVKRVTLPIPVPSVAALRARAWMVLPPLLLGALAAVIATQVQRPVWRGESKLVVPLRESPQSGQPVSPMPLQPFMQTLASLAHSDVLAARVVRSAGIPGLSAADFLRHSSVRSKPDSAVLNLSVTYRPRSAARRLTNVYATVFARSTNGHLRTPFVVVLDHGRITSSFRPHLVRNGLLGGALGALIGIALMFGIAVWRQEKH
jgi:capsular polysaccharide biosynthesis protein